jgi:predicted signal transduction protein with EAL and GGDEF domain
VTLGVSISVARATPDSATTSDTLVAMADDAIYEVKRGRHAAAR